MRERTKNKNKKNLDYEVSFQFKLCMHELEKLYAKYVLWLKAHANYLSCG